MNLTHWGRVTHICIGKLAIIGSDNGLAPDRRRAIIWTNAGIFIEPLERIVSEILNEISYILYKKTRLENEGHFVSASLVDKCINQHT